MRVWITAILLGMPLVGAEPLPISEDYWKDEAFLKSFNGSYRINARIEPTLESDERGLLVKVQKEMASEDRAGALALLEKSSLTKDSAALLFNLGNVEFELGNMEDAISSYKKALELFPSFRRAYRNLGMALVREEKMDEAQTALLEAVRLGDQDGVTMGMLGYCYVEKGQFASALQAYRMARLTQPTVAEWKAGVARCLFAIERYEEAEALLEEVVGERTGEWEYHRLLANVRLQLGKVDEAVAGLEWVRRAGELGGADLVLLGSLYLGQGDVELGVTALREVKAELDGEVVGAYLEAVKNALTRGRLVDVDGLLAGVENIEGVDMRELRKVRARRQLLLGDDDVGAELEKLVEEDGLDGETLMLLGRFYVREKRLERAALQFERATKVDGFGFEGSFEHGKMLVGAGRYEEGLRLLERAMELRPDAQLQNYVKQVRRLVEARGE